MAHPRSRGENFLRRLPGVPGMGSSPLTRGKRDHGVTRETQPRLIPAHAGKTKFCQVKHDSPEAHPRSRGENEHGRKSEDVTAGSSPLTRGKPHHVPSDAGRHRLIPAHAGKTLKRPGKRPSVTAHPRSRGENYTDMSRVRVRTGSSPLTRGKRDPAIGCRSRPRLIPAHAGKTQFSVL